MFNKSLIFLSKIYLLLKANIKVRYRQTWVGLLWVLLNPILIYLVQLTIFSNLVKNQISDYHLYLLSGLFPWFFLSQSVEMSCTQIKGTALLARNLRLKPYHFVFSLVLENFVNFLLSTSLAMILLSPFKGFHFIFAVNFLFASFFFMAFVAVVSFATSILHTLFKDIKYIAHFVFTLLYFLSPTFYKLEILGPSIAHFAKLNPLYWQLRFFRQPLDEGSSWFIIFAINFAIILVVSILTLQLWTRLRRRVFLKI